MKSPLVITFRTHGNRVNGQRKSGKFSSPGIKGVINYQFKFSVTEEFDEIDVAANAFLFFAAGFETTASTLSFCLHELAINQDIQEKLRTEVEKVKARNGEKLTADCLKDFTYMDMVLAGKGIVFFS